MYLKVTDEPNYYYFNYEKNTPQRGVTFKGKLFDFGENMENERPFSVSYLDIGYDKNQPLEFTKKLL